MANSTETFQGSENGAPAATATVLPDKEGKRTAEVQKSRRLTRVSQAKRLWKEWSGEPKKRPAEGKRTKIKATLGIVTKEQRHEAGKALREKCPRISHRDVVLGQGERDIVKLIEASNKDRLQNLVPVRHGRMAAVSVRILSRHGDDTSARPKGYAKQRDNCSFLRRLSPDEFRRLRHTRAKHRLRYQRFRRDPARTIRMGS